MVWTVVYKDIDQIVESDGAGALRTTYQNPNRQTLQTQALAALDTNRTALAAPTAGVTLVQAVNQIKNLSAQNNVLIRLVLGLLDGTN